MIEIRIHGRGGQGAVIASKVLACALFAEGRWVQAFPAFGVERRGAPVAAFVRADEAPILLRCQIYQPDQLIVLDPTLIQAVDVTGGLHPGGLILINTQCEPDSFEVLGAFQVATVDASAIALRHKLGTPEQPIVNTAILGAYAAVSGVVSLEAVVQGIEQSIPSGAAARANVEAAQEAYAAVHPAAAASGRSAP